MAKTKREIQPNEVKWVFCWRTCTGEVGPGAREAFRPGRPISVRPVGPNNGLRTIVRGPGRTRPRSVVGPRLDQQGAMSRAGIHALGYVTRANLVPARSEEGHSRCCVPRPVPLSSRVRLRNGPSLRFTRGAAFTRPSTLAETPLSSRALPRVSGPRGCCRSDDRRLAGGRLRGRLGGRPRGRRRHAGGGHAVRRCACATCTGPDGTLTVTAVVEGLAHEVMDVADGGTASRVLAEMLLGAESAGDEPGRELSGVASRATRERLLAYCDQDTRATMGVLAWLRGQGR